MKLLRVFLDTCLRLRPTLAHGVRQGALTARHQRLPEASAAVGRRQGLAEPFDLELHGVRGGDWPWRRRRRRGQRLHDLLGFRGAQLSDGPAA